MTSAKQGALALVATPAIPKTLTYQTKCNSKRTRRRDAAVFGFTLSHARRTAPAAAVVLLLWGCQSAPAKEVNSAGQTKQELSFFIPESRWQLSEVSQSQEEKLSDETLTFSEYEAAIFAYVDCVESAGGRVNAVVKGQVTADQGPTLNSRHQYDYSVGGDTRQQSELLSAFAACQAEHTSFVETFWLDMTKPSESEFQEARREIGDCIRQFGFAVSENPSSAELFDAATNRGTTGIDPKYFECVYKVQADLDLPGFGG